MGILVILFIVVPAVELAILIEVGAQIGAVRTLLLIIVTGMVGAALAKRAGLDVLSRIRSETQSGRLPADALLDGAIILVAGALLVTPGILTDAFGFACLIPPIRNLMKRGVRGYVERAVANGQVQMQGFGPTGFGGQDRPSRYQGGPVIDVTPDPTDRHSNPRTP